MARAKAYLFGGVEIRWTCAPELLRENDETPEKAVFHFPGGLKDFLAQPHQRLRNRQPRMLFAGQGRRAKAATAPSNGPSRGWRDEDGFINSYCNTVPTSEGGTHEAGLRAALTKGLKNYGELTNNKRAAQITADDIVVSIGGHAVGVHPRA